MHYQCVTKLVHLVTHIVCYNLYTLHIGHSNTQHRRCTIIKARSTMPTLLLVPVETFELRFGEFSVSNYLLSVLLCPHVPHLFCVFHLYFVLPVHQDGPSYNACYSE